MAERTTMRRAARLVAFAVGGGVALTLALSSSASADEIVVQDADVVNAGAAVANSGGNVAVGNDSDNTATTNQAAVGVVAVNAADTSTKSSGTGSITTGAATANGNQSGTGVSQQAAGSGGGGLTVAAQDADVVNAGAGVANSGINAAVGNTSDNDATTNQAAVGLLAVNTANTSADSSGTALVHTGAATAAGNSSLTGVSQGVNGGGGPGIVIAVQDADVLNAGLGVANSGFNAAIGNDSDTNATTNQLAIGLLAFNAANTSTNSSGTAGIITGAATATGNQSITGITQDVSAGPGVFVIALQGASEQNLGFAPANSGFNFLSPNTSSSTPNVLQVAIGLLAVNLANNSSSSSGLAWIVTGSSTGVGNQSLSFTSQTA